MDEASSTQPDGQEVSDEMGEATCTESDVQIENLDSQESSEMVKVDSTQPDNEEISEVVKALSTQLDSKESNEMVKAGSTQLDSQGVSEMVEAASTQSNYKEMGKMVEVTSTQSDGKKLGEIVGAASTQLDGKESIETNEPASTQPDGKESIEMVEADSTQSDVQIKIQVKELAESLAVAARSNMLKIREIVEGASTKSHGKESTGRDKGTSTQSDSKKSTEMVKASSTEMVKASSTQSGVQIKIQKNRQEIARRLEKLKENFKKMGSERMGDLEHYRLLVRAIHEKNLKVAEDLIKEFYLTVVVRADQIDELGSSIFHSIVQVPGTDALIKELVSMASPESLTRRDIGGHTALHAAAAFGNTQAVKLFVDKNRNLLSLKDNKNLLPVELAIVTGRSHKETVEYLLSVHAAGENRFYEKFPDNSARVLHGLIEANHIDLAFGFLNHYPKLADRHENSRWNKTINELARKNMRLPRRTWQRLIYHYISVKIERHNSISGHEDIENQIQTSQKTKFFAKLQYKLWNALLHLVPGIKCIHDQKLLHEQTLDMVRLMIGEVTWLFEEALKSLKEPLLIAAILGNHRFVEEILKANNYSLLFHNEHGHTILHLAVLYRQENVFNLIHNQSSLVKDDIWMMKDDTECSILHLAGRLVPSNEVPGAALQMQRELQWFKTVENICPPGLKVKQNLDKKTPREVFTEEHKILVQEGEKWMKETARACSVVAALIITVVFATAYTLPGGIKGEGLPNLLPKTYFKVFLVSIALALFSSTASVQMFLGILTSRYAEEDFLESLPKKLITGLISLLFSIASMLVAFASTFHIYLQPSKWVTFVMALFVLVPVTLFAFMEFPLLVDIFKSTYCRSILRSMR